MAAPDPASLVDWPEEFGTRFTVFVDVEEEFDWSAPLDRASRSTTAMAALPDTHRRFADRGVGLTCLIDHPIAADPAAVAILARIIEDGRSEIGSQLHAWVNPPFLEPLSPAASYAGNLPYALEAAKLDILTDAIVAAFDVAPRVYRAGRYGIGQNSHALLASRGYRIDSSVRSRYDYSREGGPDFRAVGNAAYRVADGLLELPLTTVFTGSARRGGQALYDALGWLPKGRGIAARAGLLARIALTPEDMPITAALAAVDVAIGQGERLLTLSFHSPSLAPGHTPYVRDRADLSRFHAWWDRMLDHLHHRGVRSASIADILQASDQ